MPIDMSNYKMIYKDQVFNVVGVVPIWGNDFTNPEFGIKKPQFIEATFLDEDGEIKFIRDEAWGFKFVRR